VKRRGKLDQEAALETAMWGHSKDRIYDCKCGHPETDHPSDGPCNHGMCICQLFRLACSF
jgi:hypothetical protein